MSALLALLVASLGVVPSVRASDSERDSSSTRRHHRKHGHVQIETSTRMAPPPVAEPAAPAAAPGSTPASPAPSAAPSGAPVVSAPGPVSPNPAPVMAPHLAAPVIVETPKAPPPEDDDPAVGWNPYAMHDRPVNHPILRIDLGFGGGPDGVMGRIAPGIETRFSQDWGIGFSLAAFGAGVTRPRVRGEVDADLRAFLEFALPLGWLRTQLSGGPTLFGKTAYVCTTPLCGYLSSEPITIGAFGSAELSYWLSRGPGSFGGGVRAQYDTSGSLVVSGTLGVSGDLTAPLSQWR